MRLPSNAFGALVLVAAAFGFYAIWDRRIGLAGLALALLAIASLLLYRRFDTRGASQRWLTRASISPIVLGPPFGDRWRVVAGGPDPRTNPCRATSDQWCAYDFARDAGATAGAPVLAPCDGMIVHVEDRREAASNYISIQTPHGYVLLANLEPGSALVRVGDGVAAPAELARSGERLHLYAQNRPSVSDVAQGLPVAFVDRGATKPLLLEYGDHLG